MRTPPLVTIALLLGTLAAACAAAQADAPRPRGLPDQQVTIVGRDDAALPLPLPWQPEPYAFPPPDLSRLETPPSPPFQPLSGDWAGFLPEAGYTYVGCAGRFGGTEIHCV